MILPHSPADINQTTIHWACAQYTNMGVRAALAVCGTSFLLGEVHRLWAVAGADVLAVGILSTHWIADWGTLWQPPLTDAHLRTSASYYHILASMEHSLKAVPVVVSSLGGVALLWSFRDGRAGNVMFDGASICESSENSYLPS